jgi:predicted 3-demethylubiquinone-9 3-methyltransferase (glyoxalase superfamily)
MTSIKNKIMPCLWFDSEAEEAAKLYTSIFANSRINQISRYTEAGRDKHGRDPGSVMVVEFELDGLTFIALNGGPLFKFSEAVSFQVMCDTQEEIDHFRSRLSEGGRVSQGGWLKDKFGLSWQIVKARRQHRITPCLWFDTDGEDAAKFYISIFANSRIQDISRYTEAGREFHRREPGSVMLVAFELDGQGFAALNGGPQFKFSEAVGFQVMCDSQAEIDEFWTRLTDGGRESQCGWLKDRFGLSWQIVPAVLPQLLKEAGDRSEKIMGAVMQMKKFDLEALKRAAA